TLSLRISPVSPADSGVYKAEFVNISQSVTTTLCFRVSVWEPLRQPLLETLILHQEQGRCNLSLLCTVPSASNVSYSWSCTGGPTGALEQHPWLQLQVHGDSDPTVCHCNASNPVSWATASTDVTAVCRAATAGLFSIIPLWAVAVVLLLVIAALVAACYWWWKQKKNTPGGVEQMLTIYEEVGKAQTGQDPTQNGTSEATVGGNTIYTIITKTQGPSCPQEPESCTIYSTIQPSRKLVNRVPGSPSQLVHCLTAGSCSAPQASSLKKKRLDPALVSTAYVEVTSTGPVMMERRQPVGGQSLLGCGHYLGVGLKQEPHLSPSAARNAGSPRS
ncbi:PREDICTED: natural killer cell receptor 2B4, partial [Charadrius vociferus]|uniref:natural killer cell receptor 2B4 n=1 Tax=Charadrius vociferus TaxID=50402 RepID=UPI000521C6DB